MASHSRAFAAALFCCVGSLAPAHAGPLSAVGELDGEWLSQCLPLGKNGRHGLIVRLTLSRGQLAGDGQMYAHSSCDVPLIGSRYAASVEAVRKRGTQVALDLEFQSATMTIDDDAVAALYAKNGNCGLSGWRRGVAMAVQGRSCEPTVYPAKGQHITQRGTLAGDRLTLTPLLGFSSEKALADVVVPKAVTFRRVR